jgi:hypothetical protein
MGQVNIMEAGYRNRIVGYGSEAPDQLLANPHNWRIHSKYQQEVLDSALREVGWAQSVIVNRVTGMLIDGHLRVTLAMRAGMPEVPVTYVELSEEEEKKALATLDSIGGLGVMNAAQMNDLVSDIGDVSDDVFGEFIEGLRDQSEVLSIEQAQPNNTEGWIKGAKRTNAMVKVALYIENSAFFEKALKATGEKNRAEALLKICEAFLGEPRSSASEEAFS